MPDAPPLERLEPLASQFVLGAPPPASDGFGDVQERELGARAP